MKYLFYDLVLNNPKRFEIYLSGCLAPHCNGCHNPESWDFNSGIDVDENLISLISKYSDYFDNIWILGGEPLDQDKEHLIWLLDRLNDINKKIWLFTRYEFNEIDEKILTYLDYIKTGKFINDDSGYLCEYGFKLGSSNQKVISTQTIDIKTDDLRYI